MEKTTLYIIIGLLVAFNLYLYLKRDNNQLVERNGMEMITYQPFNHQSSDELVLYYSPGCGHCISMKGEWDEFCNRFRDRLRIREVNCQAEDCGNINGVPHLVLTKNGKQFVYQGRRTADDLSNWVMNTN